MLPAVRNAGKQTIVIADGFSCREQIEQETDRKGLHLAQVLQMALREKDSHYPTPYPERKYVDEMKLKDPRKTAKAVVKLAVAGITLVTLILITKKLSRK